DLLGCLNELLIGDNKLARIPVQILTIPNLAVVDVSGNPLGPSSPPELALVKNTNTLRIARAGLKNFPPNLPSLSH
ncbi:hypothetical protein, partial [Vibrio vulnificus]|uniref:hypothetical protein n=1 Tax=Vibrio vulnificus TaxID=672 RepID=UPI0019D4A764